MSWLQKIKEILSPPPIQGQPLWQTNINEVNRELTYFKDSLRIGILCFYTNTDNHNLIQNYKKELDGLGYETEVLMYVDEKEMPRDIFLPHFTPKDLNKDGFPYNPRTDRFVKKKFDMLFNLYFEACEPLQYLSMHSVAKCRYGAYKRHLKPNSDVFVYTQETEDIEQLINKINEILQKQAYVRKVI